MSTQVNTSWSRNDGYTISTDKSKLDKEVIYYYLSKESYWSQGITSELVSAIVENSALCYGIYQGNPETDVDASQVGFARVVTDFVRYAWLGDVFVLPGHRGLGLSKWLMGLIVEHPLLQGVSFNLGTRDAHTLYHQFGFQPINQPENRLQRPLDWEAIYRGHGITER